MPKGTKEGQDPERASMYLLCRAQVPILLEVESARAQHARFVQKYNEWSGENEDWASLKQTGHALDVGTGKWGVEYRVYFIKDQTVKNQMERYGYAVENGDVRRRGTFRINSEALFKMLVQKHGLRLGENM